MKSYWLDDEITEKGNLTAPSTAIRQFSKDLCAIRESAYILPSKFTPKKSTEIDKKVKIWNIQMYPSS